jgi:16S rRNA (guanine966-N2)-methyltransferase
VRVVAGEARGRQLRSPRGRSTRPTSDRVREAVFNALFSHRPVTGGRVADLYAGSGALGIEALSRGAAEVWFVESDPEAVAVIRENLDALGLPGRATVVDRPVEQALDDLPGGLDVVLVDPPYSFDRWPELLSGLARLTATDAVVVIESDRSVTLPLGWEMVREKSYGGTVITFTAPPDDRPPDDRDATGADA